MAEARPTSTRGARVIGQRGKPKPERTAPEEIANRLGEFAEAGVQRVYLQLLDMSDLDQLSLFAAEVMAR